MGLVGVVIVAAILIGYIGSAPKPDLTPSYVMDRAESLLDHEVRVRGMVSGWDTDNDTFFLVDDQGNLSVKYSVPPPHQMEVGKEAVVIGIVKQSGGAYYVQVEEIIVGHPG
jgi:cytochrome c-type biogenesis protein CcmE